jgi:hypothetical protein
LTVTILQAGAARRVLDTDPEFARTALTSIEEVGRVALEDLDHVLGLLRDEDSDTSPQPTLGQLEQLLVDSRGWGGRRRRVHWQRRVPASGGFPGGLPDRAGGPDQRPAARRSGAGCGCGCTSMRTGWSWR